MAVPDPIEDSDNDFQSNDPIDDKDDFGDNGGNESTPRKGKAGLSRPKWLPQVEVEILTSSSRSQSAPRARIDPGKSENKEGEKVAIATGRAGLKTFMNRHLLTITAGYVWAMYRQRCDSMHLPGQCKTSNDCLCGLQECKGVVCSNRLLGTVTNGRH
jgi:hypothetical protein